MTVEVCHGLLYLIDVEQHDPTSIPFTCQATGAIGTLNAVTKVVTLA